MLRKVVAVGVAPLAQRSVALHKLLVALVALGKSNRGQEVLCSLQRNAPHEMLVAWGVYVSLHTLQDLTIGIRPFQALARALHHYA